LRFTHTSARGDVDVSLVCTPRDSRQARGGCLCHHHLAEDSPGRREFGLEEGFRRADQLLAERMSAQAQLGRRYIWGFMRPDGRALAQVAALVDRGLIRPLIDRVFPLSEVAAPHEYCEAGAARGKLVLDLTA
jgi:hypothetical protein